ncbi:MAG: DUF3726 domain-containing protein [Boseongicola sp. SB0676_bin_33]|nr:DUF3726 domain-containing protein [Boseongicola sp. SB0676_bin_33]
MSRSLNEVETIAWKAARGAGYPWGIAEEAAAAMRWLAGRGRDGCLALASLLERTDGTNLDDWSPEPGEVWSAPGGILCPLMAGAALSDHACQLRQRTHEFGQIASPVLFLPFAGWAAAMIGANLQVTWPGGCAFTDGEALALHGDPAQDLDGVTVAVSGEMPETRPVASRAFPDPSAWGRLGEFARRVHAPASEASRRFGAGGADGIDDE